MRETLDLNISSFNFVKKFVDVPSNMMHKYFAVELILSKSFLFFALKSEP